MASDCDFKFGKSCEDCDRWHPYDIFVLLNEMKSETPSPHKHKWDHKKRVCEICGKSLDKAIDEISAALHKAASDPKVIERGEEIDRLFGTLTPQDLLRRFDI